MLTVLLLLVIPLAFVFGLRRGLNVTTLDDRIEKVLEAPPVVRIPSQRAPTVGMD